MSAIHYKFSSSNDYKNVTFDGLSISVQDCKKAIMGKEKLKMTEVDLLITNAQSLQDYREESTLIPKNTALLVRRIPIGAAPASDKSKVYIVKKNESAAARKSESSYLTLDQLKKTDDLAAANASEDDKIKAMMDQSTTEYDPSKYLRPPRPGSYQRYDASIHLPNVKCYKCNQTGHYSTQCRLSKPLTERPKSIRPATGIPRSHMVQVNKDARGAMLTPDGQYVVPFIDKKGYEIGKKEKPPFLPDTKAVKEEDEDEPVPDELICLLCKEIMEDAVVIPCCGNSYCDECIRNALLESEEHECPTCHKKNISPDSLIANKFLRQAVIKFQNETGISRKKTNAPVWPKPAPVEHKVNLAPQPTKLTYGPPKPNSQTSQTASTSSAYVVKARSAQLYAAQGYTIKKATPTTVVSAAPSLPTPVAEAPIVQNVVVKQEIASVTPTNSTLSSTSSTVSSEESAAASAIVKTEPKISAVNMMVARPDVENKDSPPPPPPPLPVANADESKSDVVQSIATPTEEPIIEPKVEEAEPEEIEEPPPKAPPPVLDDMPETVTHIPIQSHGINITLKNPPPVQEKPEPAPIVDPPLNVPMPAQRAALLASASPRPPVAQPPALGIPPPRIGLPHHGLPMSIAPPTASMFTMRPPPSMSVRPPSIPTSLPPPGLMRPIGQRIGIPPMMNVLPHGVLPPHLPFPPPVGIPPPRFLPPVSSAPAHISSEGQSAPPPPGTATPPTLVMPLVKEERKRRERRSSSKPKREHKENKSPSKSRKSKLALMSDEFTREQKERVASRKRKPRRGRSETQSGSDSYSSSSYSSSSSRSSSQSSYSSSGSSSYSSSDSSRSRSRSPVRRRKKRTVAGRRTKKADSQSYSDSRSPTPARRKRAGKVTSKHRRDSRSPKRGNRARRRSRSQDGSPRRGSRYDRRRSVSRERRRRTPHEESVIPGMPPQSVLDYERDIALYDYYKQKYEQDWLRKRILPPSPFKRFISYDPTKIPPPNAQPVLRELPPHSSSMPPMPGHPPMGMYSQPPPPGDATPTEEDAGLYAYRDRTPERFDVRPGLGPWDPPMFDNDPTQRARILQEEEYYARMQQSIQGEQRWNQRGTGYIDPRFGPRDRSHPRSRDRMQDERDRRRRGRTPTMERGQRSWERDGDRWSSRDRRREDDAKKVMRDSRDREKERERDVRRAPRESRSRKEDESRTSRKRTLDQTKRRGAESSRGDSESRKRERATKKKEPQENIPPEPFPPGEGDETPVRDESRVEITDRSIKVKVINDKVKVKSETRKERAAKSKDPVSKREDRIRAASDKQDTDPSSRRVSRSRGEKPAPVKENQFPPSSPPVLHVTESAPPVPARSPTPTLDENVSPIQFSESAVGPDVLDVHVRASVSEIDQVIGTKEPEVPEIERTSHELEMDEGKTDRERERRRAKRIPSKRAVSKMAKQQRRAESPIPQEVISTKVEAVLEPAIGSRWDSDNGDNKEDQVDEVAKDIERSPISKPVKQRKIRIKKPIMGTSVDSVKEGKSSKSTSKQKRRREEVPDKIEVKSSPSMITDSRRVVVSNESNENGKQISKSSRMIRSSISHTDEATFEPDYNDNDSEKALSNYAPSDFEVEDQRVKRTKNGVRRKDSVDQMEFEGLDGGDDESDEERSDEAFERSKKKKKKKKKKRRKHHRENDDADDIEDKEEIYSDGEDVHLLNAHKEEKRRDSKQRRHEDDARMEARERSHSKKERRHTEKRGKGHKHVSESSGRKRKFERDWEDDFSEEDVIDDRKPKKSHRSPKEKRRRMEERDEISLDEDNYSIDEEPYRSPTPDDRRKYRKKQKHKKNKKESKNSKEVRSIASRIRK